MISPIQIINVITNRNMGNSKSGQVVLDQAQRSDQEISLSRIGPIEVVEVPAQVRGILLKIEKGMSKYVGAKYKNHMHGQGTLTVNDGNTYAGQFDMNYFIKGEQLVSRTGEVGVKHDVSIYTYVDGQLTTGIHRYKSDQKDISYEGQFNSDKQYHGDGKLTYFKGEKIQCTKVGTFINGRLCGHAVITWDKDKYEGEVTDETITGQGTYLSHGNTYIGTFTNKYLNGEGEIKYANGNNYKGEVKEDRPHGAGLMIYAEGHQIQGQWVNGLFNNEQPCTFTDYKGIITSISACLDGKFLSSLKYPGIGTYDGHVQQVRKTNIDSNGQIQYRYHMGAGGQGIMTCDNGDRLEGLWEGGVFRGGRGKLVYKESGKVYEGEINVDKKPHGQGRYTFTFGSYYDGQFCEGEQTGQGQLVYVDGYTYEGQFTKGVMNGFGKQKSPEGDVYEGEWRDGKRWGEGKITYKDGRVEIGEWSNGERVHF